MNEDIETLTMVIPLEKKFAALYGLLNMHERAMAENKLCRLNGKSRRFDMSVIDCGSAACLLGSAGISPWFKWAMKAEKEILKMYATTQGTIPSKIKITDFVSSCDEFWGGATDELDGVFMGKYSAYDMPDHINEYGGTDTYMSNEVLKNLTIKQVKKALEKVIVSYTSKAALRRIRALKESGDKRRMGIVKQRGTTVSLPR